MQLNGTSIFNGALEKLEHLRQDVTHEEQDLARLGEKNFLGADIDLLRHVH